MIDTVKIILLSKNLGRSWDVEEIKSRLRPFTKKGRKGYKPLGLIKNMTVTGTNDLLIVEGSLPTFYSGNSVENFSWKDIKPAIRLLSSEIGLPLEQGTVGRIDVGINFELDQNVTDYFQELFFLRYFQRIDRYRTTLRFENNSYSHHLLFYDKLKFSKRKLIEDVETIRYSNTHNLMRIELQLQERVRQILDLKELHVSDLFSPVVWKILIKKWFDLYNSIYKKAISVLPKNIKGMRDVDK